MIILIPLSFPNFALEIQFNFNISRATYLAASDILKTKEPNQKKVFYCHLIIKKIPLPTPKIIFLHWTKIVWNPAALK
jgi:hypothetical protein